MTERIDCAVIGAGVVGLAVARALALSGREVIVLESERTIGTGVSSRSSEVIHAGIYYSTGSLKARLCVSGRALLYEYCARNGIEHRRLGKLIVATSDDELPMLAKYQEQARANGVQDLRRLTSQQTARLEPEISCVGALWSPDSGIVDSHALMLAYQADLEAHRGCVVFDSPLLAGSTDSSGGFTLELGGAVATTVRATTVVNCAGLNAQRVSQGIRGLPPSSIPKRFLAKGHYFAFAGRSPFRHLVYPLANAAGLGIHVTLDLQGRARFGPDVQWVDKVDHSFDEGRRASFVKSIRLYHPQLEESKLSPAYTGIRPKLSSAGQAATDFCIRGPIDHDRTAYVALYGIESPGLTASMAIAEHVLALLA